MQTVCDPTGRVAVLTCQHIRVADVTLIYIYIVEEFHHVCRGHQLVVQTSNSN